MILALLLAAAPVTQVTVTPALEQRTLAIELQVDRSWKGDCLCLDMDGAEVAVRGLSRHPRRPSCFLRPEKGPIRYQLDLARLRSLRDDPDYAADLGRAWLFHDAATLLHPDGFETALRVRFVLGEGVSVATPWPREKDGTFLVSESQLDAGAYVALGALRTLEDVKLDGFSARLTVVEGPKAASDAQLREWIRVALASLGTFYGRSPSRGVAPIHVVLAGMKSAEPGVFGSVLRRAEPSVMLLFGDAAATGFERDWVATHELFHLGNPPTQGRYPWFVEGFTTYYTELLRARRGSLSAAKVWGTLASSVRDSCQPDGTSLRERSRNLATTHDWMRVYWAGACLALRVDVEIRHRSGGQRSLDDVLRELRKAEPLDEDELLAALDRAAGSDLASSHVDATKPLPIEALLTALGVGAVKDDEAVLRDDAPLARLRRSLTR